MASLVSIKQLDVHTIEWLLQNAQSFIDYHGNAKKGYSVVHLFFEPSTRTHLSFQMAAQRLGMEILDFSIDQSSVNKGESVIDTLQTIDAIGVDLAVIRDGGDWPALLVNEKLNMSLVNAGSGTFEHPTQALLDALTMQQHFGSLSGLTVTIVGDIAHSRVARSNVYLLHKMGATVQFAGPEAYKTTHIENVEWVDFDEAVTQSDVIMMLRIQHERHAEHYEIADYHGRFGLNKARLNMMRKDAIILHPGPVNRNVEICDEAMADPRCKILTQVKNGVAVRMAVLDWCLQGGSDEKLVSA